MKRFDLNEANTDEVRKLIVYNSAFRERVYDSAFKTGCMYVEEFMCAYPWEYSISYSRSDYVDIPRSENISLDDIAAFEDWLDGVQSDYWMFDDEDEKSIRGFINAMWDESNNVDDLRLDIAELIRRRLESELNIDTDVMMDEVDFVIENEFCGDYYVDSNWNVCIDIPEVIIPGHTEVIC